jgi:hypothetical protein
MKKIRRSFKKILVTIGFIGSVPIAFSLISLAYIFLTYLYIGMFPEEEIAQSTMWVLSREYLRIIFTYNPIVTILTSALMCFSLLLFFHKMTYRAETHENMSLS